MILYDYIRDKRALYSTLVPHSQCYFSYNNIAVGYSSVNLQIIYTHLLCECMYTRFSLRILWSEIACVRKANAYSLSHL